MANVNGFATDTLPVKVLIHRSSTVEELYLSSDALRNLSRITRYLIVHQNVVLKMSDPLVLTKVFDICEEMNDVHVQILFEELKDEMSKPALDDSKSFVFYAHEQVLNSIQSSTQNLVMRDRSGREQLRMHR